MNSKSQKQIYVAGHKGMVGSAIVRALHAYGEKQITVRTHEELDLTSQAQVFDFFTKNRFDEVYLAAAKVGGIFANSKYPADFLYENLMIQSNVINSARCTGVEKLLFLGSSCIYPRDTHQPIKEDYLMTGPLEETNSPYAIAKIAGLKLCDACNRQFGVDYRCVMPTNLYGPGDTYHDQNSHVVPALIKRIHEARIAGTPTVTIWGTGQPRRELMHVDDLAAACLHVMSVSKSQYAEITGMDFPCINIGSGDEYSIEEIATLIKDATRYQGQFSFDRSKPDGTPRKLLDSTIIQKLGWTAERRFTHEIHSVYEDFVTRSLTGKMENVEKLSPYPLR